MKKIIYALLLMFGIVLNIDIVKAEAVEVDTFEELKEAIVNEAEEIAIIADFEFTEKLTITKDLKLNGNNKVLTRNSEYKGNFITISEGVTLSINDLTIDGSAPGWKMDYDNYYYTGANNTGYVRVPTINADTDVVASASLISNSGTLNLDNTTIKNVRSTVSGAGIVGAGNNNISNSNFTHIGSSKGGGAIFLSGLFRKEYLYKEKNQRFLRYKLLLLRLQKYCYKASSSQNLLGRKRAATRTALL